MSRLWWLYLGSFLAGTAITIFGFLQANPITVGIGLLIGFVLYLNRGRIK